MKPSTLSEQVLDRKKGRIISPLVHGLENVIILNSWSLERVPEYIWFALILDEYGRETGLQYCCDKFSVVFGSLSYAFKTFAEVVDHDLGNTIIGRQSARIIIEVYIMMKYLFLKEAEIPDIWKKYKAYGIGKYKLILLKLREGMGNETTHVAEPILNALVNELLLEEFTEIDLKYFDKQAIREKAISVGEKDLYDVAYDYDSNYAHGLWGAVRESTMLSCGNVFHNYHSVPDATDAQNLADVTSDCYKYLTKLLLFVNDSYNMPKWYLDYLEEFKNG